ncbi:hypothetical protein GE09DRAFT_1255073 [Coniochaeta sp. 2T2.1]|nr:hypothetical protein GE09DRAFT_1255073 [Coniochaeta sp. 2T2.1]
MALDMSGAFNAVVRKKLLEILQEKWVPEYLISAIRCFLSLRRESPLLNPVHDLRIGRLLEALKAKSIGGVEHDAFAFSDDHHITVCSESYEKNCRALEQLHRVIMTWPSEHGVTFSPKKYSPSKHFEPSWVPRKKNRRYPPGYDKETARCLLLANIPGITSQAVERDTIRIPGVHVHYKLKWDRHVDEVTKKVDKYLLKRLDKLQRRCLLKVSGALPQTSTDELLKDLHVESLKVYLHRRAIAHRACVIGSAREQQFLRRRTAELPFPEESHLDQHPHREAYATALDWRHKAEEAIEESEQRRREASQSQSQSRSQSRSQPNEQDAGRLTTADPIPERSEDVTMSGEVEQSHKQDSRSSTTTDPVLERSEDVVTSGEVSPEKLQIALKRALTRVLRGNSERLMAHEWRRQPPKLQEELGHQSLKLMLTRDASVAMNWVIKHFDLQKSTPQGAYASYPLHKGQ